MTTTQNAVGESSNRVTGGKRGREPGTKYTRLSKQQIEALEKVYAEFPNPDFFYREKILREQPILGGMTNNQFKVWFQNRRCRDRKKANGNLMADKEKLTTAGNMLREENDRLQKKVVQLLCENEYLRNQIPSLTIKSITTGAGTGTSSTNMDLAPETSSRPSCLRIADDSLLLLAEEIRNEFLSKANGIAINWNRILTLKLPGPSSTGAIHVLENCTAIAARAFTIIPLEPIKIIEILKDQPSWLWSCRKMDVLAMYSTVNGGTIEVIYTQYDAPSFKACARDFWTLRYTSLLDDGSFVLCEKSISGSDVGLSSPVALEFVRARMLASGYVIRPCDGGSTIDLVDHLDLEVSSVPKIIRPLYQSSELVAKKIVSALNYMKRETGETNNKHPHSYCQESTVRFFGQRLSRAFNDAINGLAEDGWTLKNAESTNDLNISIRRLNNREVVPNYDGVICVKASLLLQDILPAKFVKLLKERRSSWMNFDFSNHFVASGGACFPFPGSTAHELSETAVLLGHTDYEDEVPEIIRFRRIAFNPFKSSCDDLYHLQISNGLEEDTRIGACSELIFAPIDRNMPNDAVLLSSGFRIFLLGSNAVETSLPADSTLNKASELSYVEGPCSMLVLAFQFPFEVHLQHSVALMAQNYMQHVILSVKNISLELSPSARLTIISNDTYEPLGLNCATDTNPATGLEAALDSNNAAVNSTDVNSSDANSAMGFKMTVNSACATMNSTEGNPALGPMITQNQTCAPSGSNPLMNYGEAEPMVRPMAGREWSFAPSESTPVTNSTDANPAIGLGVAVDSTDGTMNSNAADLAMLEITPDPTYVQTGSKPAIDSTGANPGIGLAATLDSNFATGDTSYAPTGSDHAMDAFTLDSTHALFGSNPISNSTTANPAIGPRS